MAINVWNNQNQLANSNNGIGNGLSEEERKEIDELKKTAEATAKGLEDVITMIME